MSLPRVQEEHGRRSVRHGMGQAALCMARAMRLSARHGSRCSLHRMAWVSAKSLCWAGLVLLSCWAGLPRLSPPSPSSWRPATRSPRVD